MLKNLTLAMSLFVSGVGSLAFAGSNRFETCTNSLQYHFLANYDDASSICKQNSSPQFLRCMEDKAIRTNLHVTDAAKDCSRNIRVTSVFDTCESRLQANTKMDDNFAVYVCDQDASLLMQNCIIDLVQKAKYHSKHAFQYCDFASRYYRSQVPRFKSCLIDMHRRGYRIEAAVQTCHEDILGGGRSNNNESIRVEPRPGPRPPRQGEVVVTPAPRPTENQKPEQNSKSGGASSGGTNTGTNATPKTSSNVPTKAPAPVEIKVQESSKPKVADQPLDSESTSNAESLPID